MNQLTDDNIRTFCVKQIVVEFEKHINPKKLQFGIVDSDNIVVYYNKSLIECLYKVRKLKKNCTILLLNTADSIMNIKFDITSEKKCDCCGLVATKYKKIVDVDIPIISDDFKFHDFKKLIIEILSSRKSH